MAPSASSLAPGLLLAAPRLDDPNFLRSVVLLGHHDEDGGIGWVLNGQVVAQRAAELLREAGLVPDGMELPATASYRSPVRLSGPVQPNSAWLLFRKSPGAAAFPGELLLDEHHAVTSARAAIDAVARGHGPREFRLLLGYAGWGAGQLETEIGAGAWLPASLDLSLLFTRDVDEVWEQAYQNAVGSGAYSFTAAPKARA